MSMKARAVDIPVRTDNIPKTRVAMKYSCTSVFSITLPPSYSIRLCDGHAYGAEMWADVIHKSGLSASREEALALYDTEFGAYIGTTMLHTRQHFLVDGNGTAVGTATAWFSNGQDGMLHWVALTAKAQGHGLSKPLLSKVLVSLFERHQNVYLITNITLARAIHVYFKMGFEPCPLVRLDGDVYGEASSAELEAWRLLTVLLNTRAEQSF